MKTSKMIALILVLLALGCTSAPTPVPVQDCATARILMIADSVAELQKLGVELDVHGLTEILDAKATGDMIYVEGDPDPDAGEDDYWATADERISEFTDRRPKVLAVFQDLILQSQRAAVLCPVASSTP